MIYRYRKLAISHFHIRACYNVGSHDDQKNVNHMDTVASKKFSSVNSCLLMQSGSDKSRRAYGNEGCDGFFCSGP